MRMNFFWIPARDSQTAETELNRFLADHRIVHVETACLSGGEPAGWSICVHWLPGPPPNPGPAAKAKPGKVDYREVLDDESFRIYAVLRSWRKEKAAELAVPIYTVATNEQLAQIARERLQTQRDLERVDGFGSARLAKYGTELAALCRQTLSPPLKSTP